MIIAKFLFFKKKKCYVHISGVANMAQLEAVSQNMLPASLRNFAIIEALQTKQRGFCNRGTNNPHFGLRLWLNSGDSHTVHTLREPLPSALVTFLENLTAW